MSAQLTRRGALRRGGSIAAAVALPATGGGRKDTEHQSVDALIAAALAVERQAAAGYPRLAASVFAGARARSVLTRCAAASHQRAILLRRTLAAHGALPLPSPPPPIAGDSGSEGALLALAIGVEQSAIAAYLAIARPVAQTPLLGDLAGAAAAHGQQLVLLREAAGLPPVPRPFENGTAAS